MKNSAEAKPANYARNVLSFLNNNIGLAAIVIISIMFYIIEPNFFGKANLQNLLSDTAPLLLMATGITFVLILGSIDLSLGGVCSVSNVLFIQLYMGIYSSTQNLVLSAVVSYISVICFGILSGTLLGFIHVHLKVPSFIASLAFMLIWDSIALVITSSPVSLPKALWGGINWYTIAIGVVGFPLLLAIILNVIFYIMQSRMPLGKYIFAAGGNERAARVMGVPVKKAKMIVFILMGMCSALAGIFLAAKLQSSDPNVGSSFTLLTIASAVVGGTALSGGKGNVLQTIIGVFVVMIIQNGMNMIGVDVYWQDIVFGAIILAAVVLTTDRSGRDIIIK